MIKQPDIPTEKFYTKEEYLAFERNALEWHEYHKGRLRQRTPSSLTHARIQMNFLCEAGTFLKKTDHHIFNHDLRIFGAAADSFFMLRHKLSVVK